MRSIALKVTLLAAAFAAAATASSWTVVASFDGPYPSSGYGIEAYGNYLYCVAPGISIVKVTTTGSVVTTIPLVYPAFDLDYDGTYFWTTSSDQYCRRYPSSGGSVLNSFFVGPITGHGIAYDGTYIWLSGDNPGGYIYRISTTGSVYSSFPCPGGYDGGLDRDGTYLWSTAWITSNSAVYKITTTGSILDSFSGPAPVTYGSSWDGVYFWTTTNNGWVYKMQDVQDIAPASLGKVKALYR